MADVQPPVPPDVWATVLAPLASATTGLAMRYAERYRAGKTFAWRQLLVDAPIIGGAFFGGPGIAEMMGWGVKSGNALGILIGYFGVRLLDALWVKLQAQLVAKVPTP